MVDTYRRLASSDRLPNVVTWPSKVRSGSELVPLATLPSRRVHTTRRPTTKRVADVLPKVAVAIGIACIVSSWALTCTRSWLQLQVPLIDCRLEPKRKFALPEAPAEEALAPPPPPKKKHVDKGEIIAKCALASGATVGIAAVVTAVIVVALAMHFCMQDLDKLCAPQPPSIQPNPGRL
eukprot:GHVT01088823.1.p2 GENE.GHVT01088823.1~~GHVT01088823.1.p2  ORF type:complete len:179 (+),score=16.73 GHVT01088823.1:139-675(+)